MRLRRRPVVVGVAVLVAAVSWVVGIDGDEPRRTLEVLELLLVGAEEPHGSAVFEAPTDERDAEDSTGGGEEWPSAVTPRAVAGERVGPDRRRRST